MNISSIIGSKNQRFSSFERKKSSDRTVPLSFSSEEPYERPWGIEILSHEPGACDLSRLRNNAPMLLDHDTREVIAVVESVAIDSDKRGRAVVRFSKNPKADEVLTDIQDNIRQKVSVGYEILEIKLQEATDDGPDVYLVTKWRPYELSVVGIDTDDGVGFFRSKETQNKHNFKDIDVMKTNEERARVTEILAIGSRNGLLAEAQEAIENGTSLSDFRAMALDALVPKVGKGTDLAPPAQHASSERKPEKFSLMRAISAMAEGDRSLASFESRVSDQLARESGRPVIERGFRVPNEILYGQRAMTSVTTGSLIGVDHRGDLFIEPLRNESVCIQAGARTIDGLIGDVGIPRQNGSVVGHWVAEGAAPPASDAAVESIGLSPKTIAAVIENISRKLRMQSSPGVEQLLIDDIKSQIGLAIDFAAINGTGAADQPTGILNTTGIGSVTLAGAGVPSWAEVCEMESLVSVDNALNGRLAYITDPVTLKTMKTTEKSSGTAKYVAAGDGTLNGYPLLVSNQIPTGTLIFGDWSQLLVGFWGELDILVDPYTHGTSGGLNLDAFQSCDIAIRHPESFCKAA